MFTLCMSLLDNVFSLCYHHLTYITRKLEVIYDSIANWLVVLLAEHVCIQNRGHATPNNVHSSLILCFKFQAFSLWSIRVSFLTDRLLNSVHWTLQHCSAT